MFTWLGCLHSPLCPHFSSIPPLSCELGTISKSKLNLLYSYPQPAKGTLVKRINIVHVSSVCISLFAISVFRASLCRAEKLSFSFEKVMVAISNFVRSK